MTIYDIAYATGGLLIIAFELYAVYAHNRQTVSHKVVAWIAKKPKTRRVLVGAGLIWLTYHWVFEKF